MNHLVFQVWNEGRREVQISDAGGTYYKGDGRGDRGCCRQFEIYPVTGIGGGGGGVSFHREIVKLSGFRSPRSVSQFFDALEKAGDVQRLPGARNLRILRHPQANSSADRTETIRVPVVGHVAGGPPILAEENIEDYIDVSGNLARRSCRYFALRVHGDSMNAAGIEDGDLVLVREQPIANAGDEIVALIDDSAP